MTSARPWPARLSTGSARQGARDQAGAHVGCAASPRAKGGRRRPPMVTGGASPVSSRGGPGRCSSPARYGQQSVRGRAPVDSGAHRDARGGDGEAKGSWNRRRAAQTSLDWHRRGLPGVRRLVEEDQDVAAEPMAAEPGRRGPSWPPAPSTATASTSSSLAACVEKKTKGVLQKTPWTLGFA
jgi:hypothetical protein